MTLSPQCDYRHFLPPFDGAAAQTQYVVMAAGGDSWSGIQSQFWLPFS